MSVYPLISVKDIVKIHYGKPLKTKDRIESGSIPVFGANGQIGFHDIPLIEFPTLVIGRKGSAGKVTYTDCGGWVIDTAFYTEINEPDKADIRYLFYALKQANFENVTITTSIPGVNRDSIYSKKIPFPPLEEQKRIAAILDKADAIRRSRQKAIALTEELLRSTFLDMFGDPVNNPKGWKTDELGKYISHSNNGLSRRRKTLENKGHIVLRLQDVRSEYILLDNPNRIALDDKEKQRYVLEPEDLLFIRVNGNKEYVGRCAVFKGFNEDVYHNDHLI